VFVIKESNENKKERVPKGEDVSGVVAFNLWRI
jgi:hypothetical protein